MPETSTIHPFLKPTDREGELGTLAHYRVIRELGRGGMGFVFEAEDTKLKRPVALKVMNQKVSAIPGSRKRFISEARSMAAVHHDNVATIFEVGESNATPFMAMEMLKGETMEAFNKRNDRLDYEQIIQYATDISKGLAAAHARGIVHRDIKPANIWIEEDTHRIKILDFGLALAGTPVDQLAGRGAVIGTPGYLSPEQARSDPLDDRSDLYSFGVVLYELCTGQLPIQSKSIHSQLISILAHRPKTIQEINPEIPQPICDTVHRLIRKEPRSRFQSAAELVTRWSEVRIECDQKSEVALAINRLKEGLDQVTAGVTVPESTAVEPSFTGIGEIPMPINDPLAGLPAAAPALAAPQAIPGPAKAMPASSGARKRSAPEPSSWQNYVPLIAIVTLALIALPIMTFAFTGFGRSDEAYVVRGPENAVPVPSANPAPASKLTPPASAKAKPSQSKPQSKPKPSPQPKSKPKQLKPEQPKESKRVEPAKAAPVPVASTPTPEPTPEPAPEPTPKPDPTPKPPPVIKTREVSVTTKTRRGADASVKAGDTEKRGAKPSIGVQSRGDREVMHSYIRFDLKPIKSDLDKLVDAKLHLTVKGSRSIEGLNVLLRGITNPVKPLWREDSVSWSNSYSGPQSTQPVSGLAILGEYNNDDQVDPTSNEVVMGGPKLAEFLRDSGDVATLVISGKLNNDAVLFYSRESAAGNEPELKLSVEMR